MKKHRTVDPTKTGWNSKLERKNYDNRWSDDVYELC